MRMGYGWEPPKALCRGVTPPFFLGSGQYLLQGGLSIKLALSDGGGVGWW